MARKASETNFETNLKEMVQQARSLFAVNPMMGPQAEQFWKAQDGILDNAEEYSRAWFQRRHEATKSALETVRKMNGNGSDAATAMQALADWQRLSMERMMEDAQQWIGLCTNCAGAFQEAEMEAGKEGMEEVRKRTKSAASTKHATPV